VNQLIDAFNNRERGGMIKETHFFDIYDSELNAIKNNFINILILGVYNAGDLYMWKKYFSNCKNIIGIDIDKYTKQFEDRSKNIFIEIGDQSNVNFLKEINNKYGKFDLIIDDASHENYPTITSLKTLFLLLNDSGIYVIEDTFCSYDKNWDSDRDKDTFGNITNMIHGDNSYSVMEYLKSLADKLHPYAYNRKYEEADEFEKKLFSIHFYDGICFLYKFPRNKDMKYGYSKYWHAKENYE